jgi:hypothetical protein
LRESFSSLAAGLGVYPAGFALPHARKHRQAFGLRRSALREPVKCVQKAACRILMRLRVYFSLALQRATPVGKQPAADASGVHKLTIDSTPKGVEAMPPKLLEGLALRRNGFHSYSI